MPQPPVPHKSKTRSAQRSLYRLLLVSLVAGLILPALIGGRYFLRIETDNARNQLDAALGRNAELLANSLREALWNVDVRIAREIVDTIMLDGSMIEVRVTDQSLGTFVQSFRKQAPSGELHVIERPIQRDGKEIGRLRVSMDDGPMRVALDNKVRYGALALAFQLLISLLAIYFLLRRRIVEPITRLVDFADRLATGDLAARAETQSNDEIGRLGKHLETMRASLKLSFDRLAASEDRFRHIVAQSPGAVFRCPLDDRERFEFVSAAIHEITGYPPQYFLAADDSGSFIELVNPRDRLGLLQAIARAQSPGSRYEIEYRLRDASGVERWLLERGQVSETAGALKIDGLLLDITERKAQEAQQNLSARIFDSSIEGIIVTDRKARIVTVNPGFCHITGYAPEEVIGRTPAILKSGRQDSDFYRMMWQSLLDEGRWQGEIWNRRKNGEIYAEWLTISSVPDESGDTLHFVGVFSDITPIKESEARLAFMAHHDALTGLPNRVLFQDRLSHAIERAARSGERLAIMFIDLDNFKSVNDTLGHNIGDKLLVDVARRLTTGLRTGDTLARLGGDEFVFLVENLADPQDVRLVAEKIVALLGRTTRIELHDLFFTASLGISIFPDDGTDAETLLRNADAAMYEAKSAGRNGYRYYQAEMTVRAYERMQLERELRRAIDRGEIHLHFQPQIDLRSGRLAGVEALARWRHPERGMVAPSRFIPLAEETGFILELGDWVLQESCRQLMRWQAAGLEVPRIAVNVSVKQVEHGHIVDSVERALAATGIDPGRLQIEVTESVVARSEDAFAHLDALRGMGIGLSIDDFGTGYSSLTYLKRLPVEQLKIDRSFVSDLLVDPDDEAIAIAVIQLAKTLHLEVVAEGIETAEQQRRLTQHGCDIGQGYLFARPAEADAILAVWSESANAPELRTAIGDR